MAEFDYNKLLDRAEALIPKEITSDNRFKIPPPEVMVQGNKTFFVNFNAIADKCEREPEHMLKYLAHELATSGLIEGPQAVFTGKFSFNLMKAKLSDYIKEFVICAECGKPDTKLLKEQRLLFMKCAACGAKHPMHVF